MTKPFSTNIVLGAVSLVAILATFLLTSPVPQDLTYHLFADTRNLFGIDNFWNVVSNVPFLITGVWGLWLVGRYVETSCLPRMHIAYIVFFSGIILTAFGSAYYHLHPANGPLVWDRLPMTIGFAGLFSIIVGEFISVRTARRILIPLLLIGYASVEYWALTESNAAGDLRPYAIVQFLPMLLIPIILIKYKPAIGAARYFWLMLAFYLCAKIFEQLDAQIYDAGRLLSGHSMKHLFAALTPATMVYALQQRRHV